LWALETTAKKPIVLCGDLNVAHQEIDIHNPKGNKGSPGFSKEERDEFTKMLSSGCGFTDSFRFLYPGVAKYSYWSNFRNARGKNMGWRIDFVLVSSSISDKIVGADCLDEFHGSDHGPVMCDLDI
jgi:exodeoxyribonuclease-3